MGFFRSGFFLSFPNGPKGNEHIKPNNIFLPEKEPDHCPAPCETLQTLKRLPGNLLGSSHGGAALPGFSQKARPWRLSASLHPETLQVALLVL